MNRFRLRGTGVALVTPFKNGKVDFDALENVIEHCIRGGVEFLVSLGTTGEAITLNPKECREVLDFTIKINAGRLPLVVGFFGDNDTARLTEKIAHFDFTGFDALMSSSPSYNKPSQEGIFQHYMKVAEVSPLPIIIYNVPSRTASNVTAATILRLAHASEKFLAVKEAAGDMVQAMQIIKNKPEHFQLLSGDDPLTLPLISCGAEGVISVIGNAFPHTFSSMVRAALDEDFVAARQLNDILLDVHPWLYVDGNPSGVKAAMEILGLCSKEVRLPLAPATDKTISELKIEIEKVLVAQTVN